MDKNKKIATSKKALLIGWVQFGLVILFSFFAIAMQFFVQTDSSYISYNLEPLSYLIPTSGGIAATVTSFYINMAKSDHQSGGITHDLAMQQVNAEEKDIG